MVFATYLQMNVALVRERTKRSETVLRLGVLVWLVLQNSVHTLLIRYSRARDVEKMFLSSVAVFFTEVIKIIACIFFIICEEKSISKYVNFFTLKIHDTRKVMLSLADDYFGTWVRLRDVVVFVISSMQEFVGRLLHCVRRVPSVLSFPRGKMAILIFDSKHLLLPYCGNSHVSFDYSQASFGRSQIGFDCLQANFDSP